MSERPFRPDNPWEFGIRATDVPVVDGVFALFGNAPVPDAEIIELHEFLEITELSPVEHRYAGKRIELDNHITSYPRDVKEWHQAAARIPLGIVPLYHYLCEARRRNIILVRGAPSDLSRQPTRRLKELFEDEPSRLLFFDIDGAPFNWRADPEAALRQIAAQMGEPWASASFVWLFSGTHGLGTETFRKQKRWIGTVIDGKVRVRLAFLLDRPVGESEALELTRIAQAQAGFIIDDKVARRSQPNYIARPYWAGHRGEDPLGDIPTIGWIKGAHEFAAVPADLKHKARWAKAQGQTSDIANHPDALSAVLGIGTDGRVRAHMQSAIIHLARSNPPPPLVTFPDHAATLAQKLGELVAQHDVVIQANLAAFKRTLGDVENYLPFNMPEWAEYILKNFNDLVPRSTIRLAQEKRAKQNGPDKQEIFDRVFRVIRDATSGVTLLIAPPGTRKSTLMRAKAVAYVRAHPGETVVILVPRAKLGDEQVEALYREHPDIDLPVGVWRGRHQPDPEFIGPQQPGKSRKMCWRDYEATELEKRLISVEEHMCGKGEHKCPLAALCGHQRQRTKPGRLWFAAHEMLVHEMPPAFGKVGLLLIDENPQDAFVFGDNLKAPFELELDRLLTPLKQGGANDVLTLMPARRALYRAMNKLDVSDDSHRGTPVGREHLQDFLSDPANLLSVAKYDPGTMAAIEWKDKIRPPIRPDMPKREVLRLARQVEGNSRIQRLAILWRLIGLGGGGRVQIHRRKQGRVIRMAGLTEIAKEWKNLPTLICNGTADATLLRAIWPDLKCDLEDDWRQLPRPDNVRVFQVVDKAFSKLMVAVEGDDELKLETKIAAARRLWAVLVDRAMDYGGQPVGIILYKSTREWIEENCNCFVPPWIKLAHHGDVAGSNALEKVCAQFIVGRSLPNAEAATRTTEALFGDYIAERAYRVIPEGGHIPIAEDAAGNNVILTDVWEHPDPRAERVRRQITEGELLQDWGRARAGLREENSPLDVFLLTNVALPEIGEVEPVLWDEMKVGIDGMMTAVGGVWLRNISDATEASGGLFTAEALKKDRLRGRQGADEQSGDIPYKYTYRKCPQSSHLQHFRYQRAGQRQKVWTGLSLRGSETRAWLEERLGKLAMFEIVDAAESREAAE